jgi:hypothetical protein
VRREVAHVAAREHIDEGASFVNDRQGLHKLSLGEHREGI